MSEAPVLVPIFPYAAEGGARPSSDFWQGNWESETNCLRIFDEKIALQAKFMKQIAPQARFFDWILMCTRFFWLNPRPIAFHWEKGEIRCGLWGITQRQGEIRCGLWGITQKKVWAAGSPLSERWNKVRAFEESLRRRCGLQAAHWASGDSDHLHCMSCGPLDSRTGKKPISSRNSAGRHMLFKIVFVCRNNLQRHINVNKISST